MLCHSCYIYGTWRSKEVGEFQVIVWKKAEGKGTKLNRGTTFMGKLTPYGEVDPFYQNYELNNIPSY